MIHRAKVPPRQRGLIAARGSWKSHRHPDGSFLSLQELGKLNNVERTWRAVVALAREAVNEGVAFEQCLPHGREIISSAHQFCAQPREIA
jgi:hypothetical protein